jgi:hypothetical protein
MINHDYRESCNCQRCVRARCERIDRLSRMNPRERYLYALSINDPQLHVYQEKYRTWLEDQAEKAYAP